MAVAREDAYRHLRIFEDVVARISSNYVEEVDMEMVMEGALRGLADGLDSESTFLTSDDVARIESGDPCRRANSASRWQASTTSRSSASPTAGPPIARGSAPATTFERLMGRPRGSSPESRASGSCAANLAPPSPCHCSEVALKSPTTSS